MLVPCKLLSMAQVMPILLNGKHLALALYHVGEVHGHTFKHESQIMEYFRFLPSHIVDEAVEIASRDIVATCDECLFAFAMIVHAFRWQRKDISLDAYKRIRALTKEPRLHIQLLAIDFVFVEPRFMACFTNNF